MSQPTAAVLETAPPEPAGTAEGTRFGEFFRYHGWLSPGVRLFRTIGFRAKAA